MKKKILIFSLAYYPKHIGGAEVALKEITNRLSPEAYEFHLVCNRYDSTLPKIEQVGNVLVYRIGWATKSPSMADLRKFPLHLNKIIFQWQAFWVAKKLHKTEHYDGIWAMMAHATGVPAAKFKRRFPEVKYLLTLQEGDPPQQIEQKMKVFGSAFTQAFTTADMIQVISTFLGAWATQMGCVGTPICIPNAVNTTHFTQLYAEGIRKEVRQELGVSEDDFLLVTTSRLVHKNGIDDVIEALTILPPAVKFVVFGVGPNDERLRLQAKVLGLGERVLFRGEISHEVMPKYLQACDAFIRPSRSEGMGNSFVEAMAAGLPVIATQEGGIADFLFDAKRNPDVPTTGWAVDANSPEQIADTVKDIMTMPDEVASVVLEAKAMVLKKYDWEVIATRIQNEVFEPLFRNS